MVKKVFLDLKNLRYFFLLPIVMVWVLLPLLNSYSLSRFPAEMAAGTVFGQMQIFVPLAGALPVIFLLRPLVEGDGHEVLYTFFAIKRRGYVSVIGVFLLSLVLIAPVFAVYSRLYPHIINEWARTASQLLFFCSLGYCLTYLCKSSLAAFLGTTIVYAAMLIGVQNGLTQSAVFETVNVFCKVSDLNPHPQEWGRYLITTLVGIALFLIGVHKNKTYFK